MSSAESGKNNTSVINAIYRLSVVVSICKFLAVHVFLFPFLFLIIIFYPRTGVNKRYTWRYDI